MCSFIYVIITLGVFDDAEIVHVEGEVDPVRDLEIIREELMKKDEQYVEARIASLEKVVVRGGDKKQKPEYVRWEVLS